MIRATTRLRIVLAATLPIALGWWSGPGSVAADDLQGSGQPQTEQSSNFVRSQEPNDNQTPWTSPSATNSSVTSSSINQNAASQNSKGAASAVSSKAPESAKTTRRKLPNALDMIKRFQKGGNPNEIMSSPDDIDADSPATAKLESAEEVKPSLVQNFGPHGVLIPAVTTAKNTTESVGPAGTSPKDAKIDGKASASGEDTDASGVAKEPPVMPESAEVLAAVRQSYSDLSRRKAEDALNTIEAMVRKEPRSMLARRACAFIMVYSGLAREAVDQLFVLASIANYQAQSFDRCTLGDAYVQLGRPDNAIIAYEDALKINPDNVQAKSGELRSMAMVGRTDEALTECVDAYKKAKAAPLQKYYRTLYISLEATRAQLYAQPGEAAGGTRGGE